MKLRWAILSIAFFLLIMAAPTARAQSEPTLAGEWIMVSTPLNGQLTSRQGITLGFPDRDMVFTQEGDLRNGVVLREDVGANVRPLGSWRVMGNRFSAAFQLWCPDANGPCGSVIMRGQFLSDDTVKGSMTVFFDVSDDSTPTGFDTWTFLFRGSRKTEGGH
jgi:hypothetical protein